jgi:hypothetical protein
VCRCACAHASWHGCVPLHTCHAGGASGPQQATRHSGLLTTGFRLWDRACRKSKGRGACRRSAKARRGGRGTRGAFCWKARSRLLTAHACGRGMLSDRSTIMISKALNGHLLARLAGALRADPGPPKAIQPARTLKGVVDAASWALSQPAWTDVAVLPSGSLQSESSMKKVASGTT